MASGYVTLTYSGLNACKIDAVSSLVGLFHDKEIFLFCAILFLCINASSVLPASAAETSFSPHEKTDVQIVNSCFHYVIPIQTQKERPEGRSKTFLCVFLIALFWSDNNIYCSKIFFVILRIFFNITFRLLFGRKHIDPIHFTRINTALNIFYLAHRIT